MNAPSIITTTAIIVAASCAPQPTSIRTSSIGPTPDGGNDDEELPACEMPDFPAECPAVCHTQDTDIPPAYAYPTNVLLEGVELSGEGPDNWIINVVVRNNNMVGWWRPIVCSDQTEDHCAELGANVFLVSYLSSGPKQFTLPPVPWKPTLIIILSSRPDGGEAETARAMFE